MKKDAISIYNEGYTVHIHPIFGYVISTGAQEFAINLQESILEELKTTGTCEFLQQYQSVLQRNSSQTFFQEDIVVMDVLQSILESVTRQKPPVNYRETDGLHYMSQFVPWNVCQNQKAPYRLDDLFSLVSIILSSSKKNTVENSISDTKEEVEVPAADYGTMEKEMAQFHKEQAEWKARTDIVNERLSKQENDLKQREEALNQKLQEVDAYLNAAEEQARNIKEAANQQAEEILVQAKALAEHVVVQAQTDSEEKSNKLLDHYLMSGHKQMTEASRKIISDEIHHDKENDELMRVTYQNMGRKVDQVQAGYVSSIDEMKQELKQMSLKLDAQKAELYQTLHEWQATLSPKRDQPIADRYIELYRLLRFDKIFANEIAYQEEQQAGNATIESLQRLEERMNIFLARYEKSLAALDLYVFYPETGSIYDAYEHTSDQDQPEGKEITEVITPGIKKHSSTPQYGDEVIVQAEVKVKE